jgi:hypothetical protein
LLAQFSLASSRRPELDSRRDKHVPSLSRLLLPMLLANNVGGINTSMVHAYTLESMSVKTPGNNILLCQAMNGSVQLGRDLHPSPSPHVGKNRGATALLVGQE